MSVKVAVVGCGAWGRNLVRNFHQLGALAAVVDQNEAICQSMHDEFEVPSRALDEVLADPDIPAVVCALAARHHYDLAVQILKAGKHIFIEKPMTLSLADAVALADLADQHQLILMTGHLPRYHPAFMRMLELIRMGEIGELRYIYSHRLGFGRIRGDESCLWDLAPHDLSMIMAVTDQEPQSTRTHGAANLEPGLVDTAMVHLSFASGVKGHIFNSWMHPFKEHRFVAVGSDGMLVFDDCQPWESKLVAYHHTLEKLTDVDYLTRTEPGLPVPLEPGEPLKLECQHFLDCVANNQEPLTGARESLRVMKVLEQIQPK